MALEIERVFLLTALPDLPGDVELSRIEQGYLETDDTAGALREGRVRRRCSTDRSVTCTHTVKSGAGMVREEVERAIDESEFLEAWPRTEGRRISKVRYRVPACTGPVPLVWEIDAFDDLPLVLAEVELPTADAEVVIPAWLAPFVAAEVTDDPRYRNSALARHGMPDRG